MDFWTFLTIVVIVIVLSTIRNNTVIGRKANRESAVMKKEIDDLKQRVNELEIFSKKGIEKRLQAIESIVVDSDYHLTMKFKELLENDNSEDGDLYDP